MAAADRVILLLLLLSSLSLFYSGKAEDNKTSSDKFTCYDCIKQKIKGNETINIVSHKGDQLEECGKIECNTIKGQKQDCYELTVIPKSLEETVQSVHIMGCGSGKTEVCTDYAPFNLEECKSDWGWETCDKDLCNKGSVMKPIVLTTVFMVTMVLLLHQ